MRFNTPISAVQSGLRKLLSALLLALLAAWMLPAVRAQNAGTGRVLLLEIRGAIGFVAASRLEKALQKAAAERASALIIRLDTPGGLVSSTRDMIQTILASPVPVILFVAPSGSRAASAGTYLAYAAPCCSNGTRYAPGSCHAN